MSVISFKEATMLLLGFGLVYSLFYLRTHDELFPHEAPVESNTLTLSTETDLTAAPLENQPKAIPQAVLETVEIPDWLSNKEDFDQSNLTEDDLLELAKLSHQQDHDFFPDNQNTLVYLLKAKDLGMQSAELDELLTSVHANLYDQAEMASSQYDAETLTALTARLRSIDANDPKITTYTNQISVIMTLQRLADEVATYLTENRLYEDDQQDAVHTLLSAMQIDNNYPPLMTLQQELLDRLSLMAMRSAQEMDFTMADEHASRMMQLASEDSKTVQTLLQIQNQKQNRFAYLDQQFYQAINNVNLPRAQNLLDELSELAIAQPQMEGYRNLYDKTQLYGAFEIGGEFTDLLPTGQPGPVMVVIPNGQYQMGSQTGPKHQRPRHTVQFDYGFAVSKHEVTVGDFKRFVEATQYKTTAEQANRAKIYDEGTGRFKHKFNINWRHDYLGKLASDDLPVIHVSWHDANAYAQWLANNTGESYRLLSESEFEYVLGSGNNQTYPWGDEEPQQVWGNFSGAQDKFRRSRIRWREGFSDYQDGFWGPAPVGSFIPSLMGLYDLSGNVMEWVEDCWHDSYIRAPIDGSAWVNRGCENRVIRGGNWASANSEYEIRHRVSAEPELTDPRIGFRVARTFNF